MYDQSVFVDYRAVNVTATGTATLLKTLVDAVLAGKSAPANALPKSQDGVPLDIAQIAITPSADIEVRDAFTGDPVTYKATIRNFIPVRNALDKLTVKNAATVSVEMFFTP